MMRGSASVVVAVLVLAGCSTDATKSIAEDPAASDLVVTEKNANRVGAEHLCDR